MSSFFANKAVRLLLAVSVSIWMAGGCLFGCSGTAAGAQSADEVQTVVSGESCHAAQSHDCCAGKKQQQPKKPNIVASNSKQPRGVPSFAPVPRGMMKDCPLVVNATAATAKNSGHVPAPARGPVSVLPLIANKIGHTETANVVSYLPNRGPTHLRCCVFLI